MSTEETVQIQKVLAFLLGVFRRTFFGRQRQRVRGGSGGGEGSPGGRAEIAESIIFPSNITLHVSLSPCPSPPFFLFAPQAKCDTNRSIRGRRVFGCFLRSFHSFRSCLRNRNPLELSGAQCASRESWNPGRRPRVCNLGVVCARNFSTTGSRREPRILLSISKDLLRLLRSEQKRSIGTSLTLLHEKSGKGGSCGKPPSDQSSGPFTPRFTPGNECKTQQNQNQPCRQPYQRTKPCPPAEKCVPSAPPCCRKRPLNRKCPSQPPPQCPPPCPTPCPKPVKPPPPKICYRKCPPPPKLPRLPKCPKFPSPPEPPPLPKLPRPPKCPPPCPPPPAPPLPKCPRAPKCPECPPQRECPPPPPCEPCPCPPPCPPPCCPPPPPCPPCPPPIPCPKPLPCPPPPPPRICPPCPPCAECPAPPPCPPPPPCCPCPCPQPPPPCPCPKPCPPCPPCPEPSCPKDVASCPKDVSSSTKDIPSSTKDTPSCPKNSGGKRKMSTYSPFSGSSALRVRSSLPDLTTISRRIHNSARLRGKSKSDKSSCQSMNDICRSKESKDCTKSCKNKVSQCDEGRAKCAKPKKEARKMDTRKKSEECRESCIPKGKCDQPAVPKPQKMDYGKQICPPTKFAYPRPCPQQSEEDTGPCYKAKTGKPKKEICVPPPLPKPPTKPVILCPCPPPPKLHPGPCPCYDFREDTPSPLTMPPCPVKEKYICSKEPMYCPLEKKVCKRDKKCDRRTKKKEKES